MNEENSSKLPTKVSTMIADDKEWREKVSEDGALYEPELEGRSLRRNRVKKTPFQLIEDPNDKRKYLSSSTSSIVPPKKVPIP